MAKSKSGSGDAVNTVAETAAVEAAPAAAENTTLTFRRNHPGNRCSYGIAGNSGIVVIDRGLFVGTTPTTETQELGGMPQTLSLDALLVAPKASVTIDKQAAQAAKLAERAAKAQAKLEASAKRVADAQAKAQAKVEAAQAKLKAAQATAPAAPEVPTA